MGYGEWRQLRTVSAQSFPKNRAGTERVKLCKQWLVQLLKGASFDSSPSVEINFWHDKPGVVALQHYICYIVFCSLDFDVFVYKGEGFFPPLKWDLFASYLSQQRQWAGKKCLCLLDSTCWPTLNDVEIIKFNERDWVSGNRAKHLPLKTLIFCNWIEVGMSASENSRINGPKLSKVPLTVLLNVTIVFLIQFQHTSSPDV